MTISLENQVVLVTGGARRLGRAIALECARSGASVGITYNTSVQEAQSTTEEMRAQSTLPCQRFAAFACDLTRLEEIATLRDKVLAEFGTITALVNNAAIFRRTPFEETDATQWERAFDEHVATNLKAPYLLCKYFGDFFLQQGTGSILNVADIHGLRPLKNYVPYCISKAGVITLTEALAKALAPNVRVNCLCPGTILIPSESQGEDDDVASLVGKVPLGRLGTPEELAQVAVFLIGGPQFATGVVLPVDGAQRLR